MPSLREFVSGPWRAVLVLGVTQIICWGTLFYPPVLTVPLPSGNGVTGSESSRKYE